MGKKKSKKAIATDLVQLVKASPAVRRLGVDKVSKEALKLLCGCSRDILKGKVPLSNRQKTSLRPYKKDLRKFASSDTNNTERREILKKGKKKNLFEALVHPGK